MEYGATDKSKTPEVLREGGASDEGNRRLQGDSIPITSALPKNFGRYGITSPCFAPVVKPCS